MSHFVAPTPPAALTLVRMTALGWSAIGLACSGAPVAVPSSQNPPISAASAPTPARPGNTGQDTQGDSRFERSLGREGTAPREATPSVASTSHVQGSSERSSEMSAVASSGSGSLRGPRDEPPPISTDWCTAPVQVLDQDTCYVLPEEEPGSGATKGRRPVRELLVYLHGIVPPAQVSPQKTHFQAVVASAARRAGVAALIPRGKRGLAPKGFAGWWGWPTSAEAYEREGAQWAALFEAKQRALEGITGQAFERRYLAGSSAGAYFVTLLMAGGAFPAQGYIALAGGAIPPNRALRSAPEAPVYIGYGKSDPVGTSSRALAQSLERAGWAVRLAVHPVPHGASEIYLDEAFAFFRSNGN